MEGKQECVLGITADDSQDWTFGQVFLKKFYSVFDVDASRIGSFYLLRLLRSI